MSSSPFTFVFLSDHFRKVNSPSNSPVANKKEQMFLVVIVIKFIYLRANVNESFNSRSRLIMKYHQHLCTLTNAQQL